MKLETQHYTVTTTDGTAHRISCNSLIRTDEMFIFSNEEFYDDEHGDRLREVKHIAYFMYRNTISVIKNQNHVSTI